MPAIAPDSLATLAIIFVAALAGAFVKGDGANTGVREKSDSGEEFTVRAGFRRVIVRQSA